MRTTFILHGGFKPEENGKDRSDFYKEIMKITPEAAKVLLVPFAKDIDRAPEAATKVASQLIENKWQENINIDIANEIDFLKQVHEADVIYFHGGASLKLLNILKNYPNLDEYLEGKIIAGESAGANVWGVFFYSPKSDTVSKGLGILPVKIIPHYMPEYKDKLSGVGADLEEVFLPEYTYKTFIVN